jgi:mono/diheme cytochrome c family protein
LKEHLMKIPSAAIAAVITLAGLAVAAVAASAAGPAGGTPLEARGGSIAHGRYLATISGCHDCHTPGYARSGGQAPVANWLTGSGVGYQGPRGTAYPANLRLTVQSITEAQWLVFARAERRPPMPWFSLREMSDRDLTDIYRFIRSLGPTGVPAPAAVPPGGKVNTPFIVLEPQNLGGYKDLGGPTMSQAPSAQSEPRS